MYVRLKPGKLVPPSETNRRRVCVAYGPNVLGKFAGDPVIYSSIPLDVLLPWYTYSMSWLENKSRENHSLWW